MEIYKSEIGDYRIETNAFKDIAKIAAQKAKNVGVAKKGEYVACKIAKNGDMTMTVSIRVRQGCDVVKTCSDLQDTIFENILMMTGVECKNINIDIQGFYQKTNS